MRNPLSDFIRQVRAFKSENELKTFLEGILTPAELDEIPKRLQIVNMLKQGVPQREIAEKLGVGIATVTRGSRVIAEKKFERII